jgi:hypothetical protein
MPDSEVKGTMIAVNFKKDLMIQWFMSEDSHEKIFSNPFPCHYNLMVDNICHGRKKP